MDAVGTTIGVCPVGCSVFAGNYFACDMVEAAHGRAPAVATAIKRTHPNQPVFTYQGDGDLASIGAAEIVHAAMRGEKIHHHICKQCYLRNDRRRQMAPTTLIGQRELRPHPQVEPEEAGWHAYACCGDAGDTGWPCLCRACLRY
ncbi:thiamine pyrophosphate-dependent enzyme [Oscillospiraceae bacterium MB24-C1]|nr:thiamine pyrophosphate-dependent enzyme [Oscillospiraceae bacterium MB24-C1]